MYRISRSTRLVMSDFLRDRPMRGVRLFRAKTHLHLALPYATRIRWVTFLLFRAFFSSFSLKNGRNMKMRENVVKKGPLL